MWEKSPIVQTGIKEIGYIALRVHLHKGSGYRLLETTFILKEKNICSVLTKEGWYCVSTSEYFTDFMTAIEYIQDSVKEE